MPQKWEQNIRITVSEKIYLRDPDSSELGRRIVQNAIDIINEVGFESFTFKKLATRINSTEASVYRYFENKHKLLIYLISWYWNWLEYRLMFDINNLKKPVEKLKKTIHLIANPVEQDPDFQYINEHRLHQVVVSESAKAYLTKEVEQDNKEGCFISYNRFTRRLSQIIKEINPDYKYANPLAVTIIETCHEQQFFAQHLPNFSDKSFSDEDKLEDYIIDFTLKSISP
ncbi:MAG: TetR/AcrR family transcriptional regulator [Flavobacteriales bacterium]